jgi:protease-4
MTLPEDSFPAGDPAPSEPAKKMEPAPAKSGSLLWAIGCSVLAVGGVLGLAALALAGAIYGLASLAEPSLAELEKLGGASGSGKTFTEELVSGSHFASDKIAVIDIAGMIASGNGSFYEIADSSFICEQIKAAEEDPSVKAVVINLDTPGGEVTAADQIYHEILKLREKPSGKPAVAMMNSMAASGGYYVAAACDSIVANKLTLTASIGVIIEGYNYAELFAKLGVKSEVYKSGAMKDMLDGSRVRTEEERVIVQRLVDSAYEEFLAVVANGRKIPISQLRGKPIVDGRVLDGKQALAAGLVDKLGFFDDSVKEAAKLAKTSNYKVIRYAEAFSWTKFLEKVCAKDNRAMKISLGGAEAQTPPLRKGCLYFLPSL